jgi:hypothetical protein
VKQGRKEGRKSLKNLEKLKLEICRFKAKRDRAHQKLNN